MTVNPAGQTASNSFYNTFEGYWDNGRNNSYVGGSNFNIALSRGSYQVTADTITATKNAVNGLSSTGASLGYAGGYKFIFGLVQVDFETKERYRRDSWYYYQKVIANCEVD